MIYRTAILMLSVLPRAAGLALPRTGLRHLSMSAIGRGELYGDVTKMIGNTPVVKSTAARLKLARSPKLSRA